MLWYFYWLTSDFHIVSIALWCFGIFDLLCLDFCTNTTDMANIRFETSVLPVLDLSWEMNQIDGVYKKSIFIWFVFWLKISASFEEHQNHYLMRDITRRTGTADSMSFRLKLINKLDEDLYMYNNSILIRFNFLPCHFFKCLPYKIPAGHKIFIIFFSISWSLTITNWRWLQKRDNISIQSFINPLPYSCCGSLVFTAICWSLVFSVVNVVKSWSLHLLMILGLYSC